MAKRFGKKDWIEVGHNALKSGGPAALTIEELCETTGKTRGSFYFHFENVEAFQIALAEHWKDQFCNAIINAAPPALTRSDLLSQLTMRLDLDLETGIRKLGLANPGVFEVVEDVDVMRMDWLESLYANSGNIAPDQARNLAKIEYATFIGLRLIDPDMQASNAREIYDTFLQLTGRG